jgi:transcriptional antiterminator NusG
MSDAEEAPEGEPERDKAPTSPQGTSKEAHWYVVHTYSGYENKVKQNLEYRAESSGIQGRILRVVVPTEEEVDIKEGQRRVVERRIFPGYVFVHMVMDDDVWYIVHSTPGVTGFVGSGTKPTPLRQEEVERILKRIEAEEPTVRVSFREGQRVRIVDGPFTDFHGTVDEIDMQRGKVRLLVSFFGRETPVELDLLQVEKG